MRRIAVLALILVLSRCGDGTGPPGPPASVEITPKSLVIFRRASAQLSAVVRDAAGREIRDGSIEWSSADSSVVQVAPSGAVTGGRTGTAWVYAGAGGHQDSALVAVVLPIGAIDVAPRRLTLVPGGALPLTAVVETAAGPVDATRLVEWVSRDSTVVTVALGGMVNATGVGATYVVARGGGEADSIEVRVGLVNFRSVVPGRSALTCGLGADSAAYCWGDGVLGRLGTGTVDAVSYVPAGVAGEHGFLALALGDLTACALTAAGRAYCWGSNEWGQLGTGVRFGYAREPVPLYGGHTFSAIGVGLVHACGLDVDGQAWCWGLNDTSVATEPVRVGGNVRLASLSVGGGHACGLTADSVAYCWGVGADGGIGDSTTENRSVPTRVSGNVRFASVTAGPFSTCGLTRLGVAYCWGENNFGELGDSSHMQRNAPVPVSGGLTFTSISVGVFSTCGVSGGAAYCWGINISGEAGSGDVTQEFTTPHAVTGGHVFAEVRTGAQHACGITTAPAIAYCWGAQGGGQLGDSSTMSGIVRSPSRVAGQP